MWTTQFVLQDPADLARLRASGVAECLIDTSQGADVPAAAVADPAPPEPAVPAGPGTRVPSMQATSLEAESVCATQFCAQACHTVATLFDQARMGRVIQSEGCVPLVEDIAASMRRNASALLGSVRL